MNKEVDVKYARASRSNLPESSLSGCLVGRTIGITLHKEAGSLGVNLSGKLV